jgi:hypothetical protein
MGDSISPKLQSELHIKLNVLEQQRMRLNEALDLESLEEHLINMAVSLGACLRLVQRERGLFIARDVEEA